MTVVFKKTPVVVSFGLPACPDCEASRGDPCRTSGGATRMPHVSRERVAEIDGKVPSNKLCWLPANYPSGGSSIHPCRLRQGHSGVCNPTVV